MLEKSNGASCPDLSSADKSTEKFSLAFDAGPDSININRLEDGLYVDVNKGFTEITGFTREDVLGRTSLEIEIWHDPTDRIRLVEELKKNGNCDNLKAIFRNKDGKLLHGLLSARIINLNKTPHIISITRDAPPRIAGQRSVWPGLKKLRLNQ